MGTQVFSAPVVVLKGIGVPTAIWTAQDALDFLNEWPQARRQGAYCLARNACRAALAGEVEVDLAEEMFRGFARRSFILLEDVPATAAVRPNSGARRSAAGRAVQLPFPHVVEGRRQSGWA